MLRNGRIRSAKWIPSQDLSLAARLCNHHNRGRIYEIFWEYCDLTSTILEGRGARCWLYYENRKLSGFALGRYRQAAMRIGGAFVFEEVWGPCDGTSNELGQLSRRDIKRAHLFNKLIYSEDFKCPILLRAAGDNQFAHSIARVLEARWVNGLIVAQKTLSRKVKSLAPTGYKLRAFEDSDQFCMSNIHKEAFGEIYSPENYKAWATAPNCHTIIATHDEKTVGFIIAEKRPYRSLGDFSIAVDPTHQGKGIASALLNAAFQVFTDVGVKRVIADYLMLNTSAHVLYKKHGFEQKRIYNYFLIQEVSK